MIKGVVQKIFTKQFNGSTLTSFSIKGQDGFFSLGDKPATFNEGDSLQFDVVQRGKYNYAQNISPWTDGGTTQSAPVSGVVNGAGNQWKGRSGFQRGGSKSEEEKAYWAKKDSAQEVTQKRIEIQAARNAAIETAKFLWDKDLVPKPKKATEQYDAFLALIDTIADTFLAGTANKLAVQESEQNDGKPLSQGETPPQEVASGGNW